jgi:hypothetical protein
MDMVVNAFLEAAPGAELLAMLRERRGVLIRVADSPENQALVLKSFIDWILAKPEWKSSLPALFYALISNEIVLEPVFLAWFEPPIGKPEKNAAAVAELKTIAAPFANWLKTAAFEEDAALDGDDGGDDGGEDFGKGEDEDKPPAEPEIDIDSI